MFLIKKNLTLFIILLNFLFLNDVLADKNCSNIKISGKINRSMPLWIIKEIFYFFFKRRTKIDFKKKSFLILGVAYKKNINDLKILLANNATTMLHGEEESKKCFEQAKKIFSDSSDDEGLPVLKINSNIIKNKNLSDLIISIKLENSKSEIKRLIQNPNKNKKISSVVIITHVSKDKYLNKILKEISKKNYIKRKPKLIRIDD